MGVEIEIKNIEELLSSLLVGGKELVSYETERLLAAGENYGSTMLRLKIHLKGVNGEETVNCVTKLVPPSEFLWKIFNTPITFKREVAMYKTIGPTLNEFGKEHGVENLLPLLPDYVGARFSLDPQANAVDHDAALILRNMTEDGYVVGDRFTGFDRNTTILLLKDLATLHASVIAFKLAKPDEFKEKILSVFNNKMEMNINEESWATFMEKIKDALSKDELCVLLTKKVMSALTNIGELLTPKPREPFGTIVHNDFWTNNMMVKFRDDRPISTKFLDFQIIEYDNPANDVLFLLYSSTRLDLLTEVDDFLTKYFDYFTSVLNQLHCDTKPFSKEAFLNEVRAAASKEFLHVMFMLQPLFTKKGKAKELSDMKTDTDIIASEDSLHENYYHRLHFIVKDFVKRRWV